MIYIVTYIDVQPAFTGQAIDLVRQYRQACSAESGNLWTEAMQERSRRTRFVVIEAWKDESSSQNHDAGQHTADFRATVRTIHNSPNDQRIHHEFSVTAGGSAHAG